jgi:hypothetical protein
VLLMPGYQFRRSCRVALSVPIRVFATDYRGVFFTEDSVTVVVNRHGAKIRMAHQLLPDQEINLYSHATHQDAPFRVVARAEGLKTQYTYWGVESLAPEKNLWGVELPILEPGDQITVRVTLECPTCSTRVSLRLDEKLLAMGEDEGGIPRSCLVCETSGRWKVLPFHEV